MFSGASLLVQLALEKCTLVFDGDLQVPEKDTCSFFGRLLTFIVFGFPSMIQYDGVIGLLILL